MKYWHDVLPKRYGIVDRFNHQYPVKNASSNFFRTLEIGAGNGEHLAYENLDTDQEKNYYALDIRENMIAALQSRFPKINSIIGDCQSRLNFDDDFFDRIIAIHVLEHLPDLPAAVREIYRLCNKKKGSLTVVIPCEGGVAYSLARKISAQRIFESRYKQSYKWFIEREHINLPNEIFENLSLYFKKIDSTFFPFPFKYQFCNLCIGAIFVPK